MLCLLDVDVIIIIDVVDDVYSESKYKTIEIQWRDKWVLTL